MPYLPVMMKQVELTLTLLLPVLLIITPLTLPFLSLSGLLQCWLCSVFLLSIYCSTYLLICTPRVTKPTTRLSNIKSYFTRNILLILGSNIVFSYFISGITNIWYTDVLHENLSLFWSTVTSQYFMFHSLVNYKYKYTASVVKLKWFNKFKLNFASWMKESTKQAFQICRYVLPVYMLLYKDLTTLTSLTCGSPDDELSYYFLFRPSTILNILFTTFTTHLLLNMGHHAILHTAASSTLPKIKGQVSVEKCAEELRNTNPAVRHHALLDLLAACRSSYNARQTVLGLQDGHPVLWHIVYKEWVTTLSALTNSLQSKPSPATTESVPPAKSESVRPVCRPLAEKQTTLYSLKDNDPTPDPSISVNSGNSSKLTALLTGIASDAMISFKKNTRDMFLKSRVGKYLLTELSEVIQENKLSDVNFLKESTALCEVLCCAAPTEDRFGVVQLVLPEILDTATAALRAIDQTPITGSSSCQTHLKRSLHLFLYHVTSTYQEKLFNLALQSDTVVMLQQYSICNSL